MPAAPHQQVSTGMLPPPHPTHPAMYTHSPLPPALLSLGTESAVYPTPAARSKEEAEQKLHPHLPRHLILPNSGSTKVKFWTLKFPWAPFRAGRWGHDPTVGTP